MMGVNAERMSEDEAVGLVEDVIRGFDAETRRRLIDRIGRLIDSEIIGSVDLGSVTMTCPRCGCGDYTRHGTTGAGTQRYRCSRCLRTFTHAPGNLFKFTKLERWQWHRFAECFVDLSPLTTVMERCGVCLRTAWFMRHRVMELIYANNPSFEAREGVRLEVDEIYLIESFKGNMRKAGFKMPREPYRHGGRSHPRGINGAKICIVTGINDMSDFFYEIACRAPFTRDAARETLSKSVTRGTVVATDNLGAYVRVLREMGRTTSGIDHTPTSAKSPGPINRVNALHRRIRGFYRRFNGFSSKYYHLYLAWFKWLESFKGETRAETSERLESQMLVGSYGHTRRALGDVVFPFMEDNVVPVKYPLYC